MIFTQVRSFTTSAVLCGQGRVMSKLLNGVKKQKKYKYVESPVVPITNTISSITKDGQKSINTRRINMLSKLFMRHITDLMSTGTYSSTFTGHGIEINRVRVAPDFKRIQVYWLSRSDSKTVENMDELLKAHAGHLRHELSQLRVMGVVPKIEFVKDVQFTMLKLLDEKLTEADYGEDHVPVDNTIRLKQQLELQTNLESKIRKQIEGLDQDTEEMNDLEPVDVPEMPQNVLGLDHAAILQRVMKSINKSKAPHREASAPGPGWSGDLSADNPNPVTYPTLKSQRAAFKEFLNKRELARLKAKKIDKTYRPEMDYLEEESAMLEERHLKKYDFHEYLLDDSDFIEDTTDDTRSN